MKCPLPSKSWCIKLYHPDMCVSPLLQEASTLRLFSSHMDEIDRLIISPVDKKFSSNVLSPWFVGFIWRKGGAKTKTLCNHYVLYSRVMPDPRVISSRLGGDWRGQSYHYISTALLSEQGRMALHPDLRQQVIHIYKGELHLSPLPKSTGHWR